MTASSVLARDKFRETQYFLDKMRETRGDSTFRYNLSAFLSAGRSITFHLQKQFNDSEVFESWYELKQDEMRDDEVLKFIDEHRDYIIHKGPAKGVGRVRIRSEPDSGFGVEVSSGKEDDEPRTFSTTSTAMVGDLKLEQDINDEQIIGPIEVTPVDDDSSGDIEVEYHFVDLPSEPVPDEITNRPICEVAEDYLSKIDGVLKEWEQYLAGDMDKGDLV